MAKSMGIFNQERYHPVKLNDSVGVTPANGRGGFTDGLANHAEAVISFFHVPSESDIFFKAFVTTFTETYTSDWNAETVFGRTDPIYTFKNTQRRITLGWKIPATTIGEGYENLAKVQQLAQFLYPNYADLGASGNILSQSPLVRLKVMNLAQATPNEKLGAQASTLYNVYKSTNNPSEGLLGAILNVNINHNLDNPDIGVFQPKAKQNLVIPKMIEVSIDFACIHEATLGWDAEDNFMYPSFPYNAVAEKESFKVEPGNYNEKLAARQAKEQKRQIAEQDRANAAARGYDGMFGNRRLKKDAKQLARIEKRNERRAQNGKEPRARDVANADYLESAMRGQLRNNPEAGDMAVEAYYDAGGGWSGDSGSDDAFNDPGGIFDAL
tara:strand:- start:377 stop:1525 length:1149 start_codon:yes stop_codon:yes gene_type:complete